MITFIDDNRGIHGVEPICNVLPIAPSTYHKHVAQRQDPSRLSARAKRDLALKPEVARVFAENFAVYGVRKVWRQMQREGHGIARCTVERLMRELGLAGVIRGKPVRTTISDKAAPCPLDHEADHPSRWAAVTSIAEKIGCSAHTLLEWVKKAEVNSGKRAGVPTELADRLKALERENRELRQANEILRKASAYFAQAELDRPFKR